MNTQTTAPTETIETIELTDEALASVVGGCNPESDSGCGGGNSGGDSG